MGNWKNRTLTRMRVCVHLYLRANKKYGLQIQSRRVYEIM